MQTYTILHEYVEPMIQKYDLDRVDIHDWVNKLISLDGSLRDKKARLIEVMIHHDLLGCDCVDFSKDLHAILLSDERQTFGNFIQKHSIKKQGAIISEWYKVWDLDWEKPVLIMKHWLLLGKRIRLPMMNIKDLRDTFDMYAPDLFINKYWYNDINYTNQQYYTNILVNNIKGKKILVWWSYWWQLVSEYALQKEVNEDVLWYSVSGPAWVSEQRITWSDPKIIFRVKQDQNYNMLHEFIKHSYTQQEIDAVPPWFWPALQFSIQDKENFKRKVASIWNSQDNANRDNLKKYKRIKAPFHVHAWELDTIVYNEVSWLIADHIPPIFSRYDEESEWWHGTYVAHPEKYAKKILKFNSDFIDPDIDPNSELNLNSQLNDFANMIDWLKNQKYTRIKNFVRSLWWHREIRELVELWIQWCLKYRQFWPINCYILDFMLKRYIGVWLKRWQINNLSDTE